MNYPPCKECGATHGMGIENMESGEITPIDVCYQCLMDRTWNPVNEQIHLTAEYGGGFNMIELELVKEQIQPSLSLHILSTEPVNI